MRTAREGARIYRANGLWPIHIPAGSKAPITPAWQNERLDELEITRRFVGICNIGILLGAPSRGLVDIDLDCVEAIRLAPRVLATQTQTFGRASKRGSHYLYLAPDAETLKFADGDRRMLVELRSTGCQTIFPCSVHPSGETVEFDAGCAIEPAPIAAAQLTRQVRQLAVASLLAQHGVDDDSAVALAGAWDAGAVARFNLDGAVTQRVREWLELDTKAAPKSEQIPRPTATLDDRVRRARAYVARMPPGISGAGGHSATFAVALVLVQGFDLPETDALSELREFNLRCDPPWSDRELEHKIASAATSAKVGRGWLLEDSTRDWRKYTNGAASHPAAADPSANVEDGSATPPPGEGEATAQPAWPPRGMVELGDAITEETIAAKRDPVPTRIAALDENLGGGFHAGEVTSLQAGPGGGKTTMMLMLQCNGVADDSQRSGLYVSTEMQPDELQARRACQLLNAAGTRCSWRDPLTGRVPLERTREVTKDSRVFVLPTRPSAHSVTGIRTAMLQLGERFGKPPFLVVDYVQGLAIGIGDDRRLAVGETIYALQALAVEFRTPVVAVSSVNRGTYSSKERRDSDNPLDFLGSSKEAGEIEYASATVLHLDMKPEEDEGGWRDARLIICKSRFGRLGITGLRFHGASGRFEASPTAGLSELELEVLERVDGGVFASANDVAKAFGKNRPAVLAAVKNLRSRGLILVKNGVFYRSVKTDHLGHDATT